MKLTIRCDNKELLRRSHVLLVNYEKWYFKHYFQKSSVVRWNVAVSIIRKFTFGVSIFQIIWSSHSLFCFLYRSNCPDVFCEEIIPKNSLIISPSFNKDADLHATKGVFLWTLGIFSERIFCSKTTDLGMADSVLTAHQNFSKKSTRLLYWIRSKIKKSKFIKLIIFDKFFYDQYFVWYWCYSRQENNLKVQMWNGWLNSERSV